MQKPLPEDAEPLITVLSLPVGPASPGPRPAATGHTHAGPVFAYILEGEVDNQVEPDPPQIYKPGEFFYEAPMHVHKFLRNRSTTEPAKVLVFQAGKSGTPAPVIKVLLQQAIPNAANQQLSLFRLTLPPGAFSDTGAHSNPAVVYVLQGKVEGAHAAGDVFAIPPKTSGFTLKNASESEPARLLIYEVTTAAP